MTVPVAATAWGKRLLCAKAQAAPLEAFAAEYIGGGPEDVPLLSRGRPVCTSAGLLPRQQVKDVTLEVAARTVTIMHR